MNNWKETTLGEITEKVIDNRGKTPPIVGSGYEILEVNAISEEKREPDYSRVTKFVDEKTHKTWFRNDHIKENDILIPTVGTIGNVSFSKQNRGSIAQNLIALRIKEGYSPLFIYYKLKSPNFKRQILNLDIGGVQPSVKVPHLLTQEILLPALDEQKKIAAMLSSLDDKIELLRKQNETLEKIAQGIFKEWFADFKINGAKLKLKNGVPEGWMVGKLTNIANFLNGFAMQKFPSESKTDYLPVIKIKEMNSGITDQTDKASKNIPEKYIVNNGDILFSWSGSLDVDIWKYGKGALNQHLFKVTSEKYPKWFYFYWIKYHLPNFRQIANAKAVTMGHIQRHHLDDAQVVIPDDKSLEMADQMIAPIFEKSILNNSQIQTLSRLRDMLLPKLMSGKMRLFDKNHDICNTEGTGFRKKSKRLSEVRKTDKKIKEEKQSLKEHHRKLQKSTFELTDEVKDGRLKVEVDGLRLASSSASSFRETAESDFYKITGDFSRDFFILKKEMEEAVKKIKKGPKNKKDSQYKRFYFVPDNPDEAKLKETSLSKFLSKEPENIERICRDILDDKYKIDPYFGFLKNKGKKKFRPILAPSIKDKVVFTWILDKIKHNFSFLRSYSVFGSYPNKRKIIEILKDVLSAAKKYGYILKVDIESFYPSIERDRLMIDLEREGRIKNKYFLKIIKQALENKTNPKNKREEKHFPKTGIPQGCAFSPLLANYYAYKMDKHLKDQKLISFRYLDDLIVFAKKPLEAKRIFAEIEGLLKRRGLKLHMLGKDKKKSYIVSVKDPFEYLGIEIEKGKFKIPNKKINEVSIMIKTGILNKGTVKKFKKEDILKRLENYISGWKNYYKMTCRKHFYQIITGVNTELKNYYKRFPEIIDLNNEKYYL